MTALEDTDVPFSPDCMTCAYYGVILPTLPIEMSTRPQKGITERTPRAWNVGVCCHDALGGLYLIADTRAFGSKCGPMGRLYEKRDPE